MSETPDADTTGAADRCRDALLAAITSQVSLAPNATTLLRLAEAYAWTVQPAQTHGASESA